MKMLIQILSHPKPTLTSVIPPSHLLWNPLDDTRLEWLISPSGFEHWPQVHPSLASGQTPAFPVPTRMVLAAPTHWAAESTQPIQD